MDAGAIGMAAGTVIATTAGSTGVVSVVATIIHVDRSRVVGMAIRVDGDKNRHLPAG